MKLKGKPNSIFGRIIVVYALATGVWIFFSELLVHSLIHDLALLNQVTMAKELLYIAVSSSLLYALFKRYATWIDQGTAELRESESRYSTLIENSRDGIFIQTGGCFAYLNTSACNMFGAQSADELIGSKVMERYHPDYRDKVQERIRIINEERRPVATTDEKCLRMDGTSFDIDLQAVPFSYEGENGALVYFRDITAIKQTHKALKESDELFRILSTLAPVGVYLADTAGSYQYVNENWSQIAGMPKEDAYGMGWVKALHPDDRDMVVSAWHGFLASRGNWQMEYRFKTSNDEVRWVFGVATPYMDADGNESGFIGANIDITAYKKVEDEQKSLEERLRQASKMESIGTLAGGVAHDFNNILTVIMGACTLLNMKIGKNEELEQFVNQIYESSERAARLTQSLLAFSRKQHITPRLSDLNEIVMSVMEFLKRIIGEDVRLETSLNNKALQVFVDRGQIEQVLMNLVVNARDAMPNGGVLRIETTSVIVNDSTEDFEGLRGDRYALITVSDTGMGMDKETQSRIFEPFFTTKERGRGTGLGLSMAYGIIKQHEGVIDVCSTPGKGTKFSLYLPHRQVIVDEVTVENKLSLPAGNETILLVEDDDEVRVVNGNILTSVGYNVLAASNGSDALMIFNQHKGDISLVILDVIMPGMNGKELHDSLKCINSEVKILFASGYSADLLHKKGVVPEEVNFLSKPFTPHVFLSKVRGLIDQPNGG